MAGGGSKGKVNRDKEMAADLRSRGIFHGKHTTSTAATHNYPRVADPPGSSKYRRYLERLQGKGAS